MGKSIAILNSNGVRFGHKIENGKWKIMVGKTICKSEKHCRPTVFVYMEVVANLYGRILYACK